MRHGRRGDRSLLVLLVFKPSFFALTPSTLLLVLLVFKIHMAERFCFNSLSLASFQVQRGMFSVSSALSLASFQVDSSSHMFVPHLLVLLVFKSVFSEHYYAILS